MAEKIIEEGLTVTDNLGGTVTYKITVDATNNIRVRATKYVSSKGKDKTVGTAPIWEGNDFNKNIGVLNFYNLNIQSLKSIKANLDPSAAAWAKQTKNAPPPWIDDPVNDPSGPGAGEIVDNLTGGLLTDFQSALDVITGGGGNLNKVGANNNFYPSIPDSFKQQTLVYPLSLEGPQSKSMDTVLIQQISYAPPNAVEFAADPQLTSGQQGPNSPASQYNVFTKGLLQGTDYSEEYRKKELKGTVILPMPQSFVEKRNVQFGEDTMNTLSAGLTQKVLGDTGGYLTAAGLAAAGGAGLAALGASGAGSGIGLGGITGGARAGIAAKGLLDAAGGVNNSTSGKQLLSSVISSNILKAAGANVSAETILARGAGVIPNPNMELLFRSPVLRDFGLAYRMTARSRDEAIRIRKIIRFFKQGMSPKNSNTGENYFIKTPNVFQVEFKTTGDEKNKSMPKFKMCALTGFDTDYSPDNMWAAYDDGQPVAVTILLQFKELTPIYTSDFEDLDDDEIGY